MSKFLRIGLIVLLSFLFVIFALFALIFLTPVKIEFDQKKLITTSNFITFYDEHNLNISSTDGKSFKEDQTPFCDTIKHAFISIEDKNFYKHNGIDYKRILKALAVNIKNFSFKQGASTISQQLIKNTHLSNEKTLSRKITEIKLTQKLEKQYTKDQILDMYLNTIYFGDNCFGLYSAAKHYFNKSPNQLSLAEIATLAGLISSPSKLNPITHPESCQKRRNFVIEKMYEQGYINENQKNEAINTTLKTDTFKGNIYTPYLKACIEELEELYGLSPYLLKDCKILTYYNGDLQKELASFDNNDGYQSIILENHSLGVKAYYSTVGQIEREIASCGKPLYIYAPAIEENYITPYTKIIDEPVDFNGYKPKNYGDKYWGEVTCKEALSKSLNIPAVKILDTISIKKAKKYANLLGIEIKSDGLGIALGNLQNGVSLKNLAAAYTTFANLGKYKKPHFIKEIKDSKGDTIYNNEEMEIKVFSPSTASYINDSLIHCAKYGTAKKLSYLPYQVAAKTGTNGDKSGNIDCYSVCYTSDHTIACWLGNPDNSPVSGNQTGGGTPTYLVGSFLEALYQNSTPKDFPIKDLNKISIDKISYENDGEILLADANAPEKYVMQVLWKKDRPKPPISERFSQISSFEINQTVSDEQVVFNFCLPPYVKIEIYRKFDGIDQLIYSGNEAFSDTLQKSGVYEYYAVFTICGKQNIVSQPVILKSVNYEKTDGDPVGLPDNWWIDDC